MIKPLFAIVHERMVPVNSSQAAEIARIKKEERWIHIKDDLSPITEEIQEQGWVYVCGAFALNCVMTHLAEVRKARGSSKGTFLYEPATISIRESTHYL